MKAIHLSFSPYQSGFMHLAAACFLCVSAGAAPEKWTNKDGKSANLEFVRLTEKDGEEAAVFKMTNGKAVTIKLSALVDADAKRARDAQASTPGTGAASAADGQGLAALDGAVTKVKAGEKLTPREKEICQNAFLERRKELFEKHHCTSNSDLPDAERAEFFTNAMKMSLIDFSEHGGWPIRSEIRLTVLDGLKKSIAQRNEPFVRFCAIFPALDGNDLKFAVECYKKLEKSEPYLAERIAEWLYGHYENKEVKDSFVKATGIRPPAQERVETSDDDGLQAVGEHMDFFMTTIQPLLKDEKFDEAVAITEKRFKDNPGLPHTDLAGTLVQIAVAKGIATGDADYTMEQIEQLKKRFPDVPDLRMPGVREMVEKQIKTRKQPGGGGDGDDEVSPPR